MQQLAIFLLGSNIGNRLASIEQAVLFLTEEIGQPDIKSSVYESAPWGKTDQPRFLNQVVSIRTGLDPLSVLDKCLAFEDAAGRIRTEPWGPRTIDIDILYFGQQVIDETRLRIPHPGIPVRRFTLIPLCEIHPDMPHPESGITQFQLLNACSDQGEVILFNEYL